ncbi:hypothetical protein ABXS75_14745 [Roseburia hominis]
MKRYQELLIKLVRFLMIIGIIQILEKYFSDQIWSLAIEFGLLIVGLLFAADLLNEIQNRDKK